MAQSSFSHSPAICKAHGLHNPCLDYTIPVYGTGKIVDVTLKRDDTFLDVKRRIFSAASIPADLQTLVHPQFVLLDSCTVNSLEAGGCSLFLGLFAHSCQVFIRILVEQLPVKIIATEIQPFDTVSDIKEKICHISGICKPAQRLMRSGLELEDGHCPLLDCQSACSLSAGMATFDLHVVKPSGSKRLVVLQVRNDAKLTCLTLSPHATDTIVLVKRQVCSVEGIPVDEQLLYLGTQLLENKRTLGSYVDATPVCLLGFVRRRRLGLAIAKLVPNPVRLLARNTAAHDAPTWQQCGGTRRQTGSALGHLFASVKQRVTVVHLPIWVYAGQTPIQVIVQQVQDTTTASDLKHQICVAHGIRKEMQRLRWQRTEVADDAVLFGVCGLMAPSTGMMQFELQLQPSYAIAVVLQLQNDATLTCTTANRDATIQGLKSVVQRLKGIPAEEQVLYLGSQLLEDGRSLASYNVQPVCVLAVRRAVDPFRWKCAIKMPSNLPDQKSIWDLQKASPEYKAVEFAFLSSIVPQRKHRIAECPDPPCSHFAPAMRLKVSKIQLLRNLDLLAAYTAHRDAISASKPCRELPSEFTNCALDLQEPDADGCNANEYMLYHGSKTLRSMGCIINFGFDPERSRKCMFGKAAYFAPNACKSHSYTQKAKGNSLHCIVAARVCLGEAYIARQPMKDATCAPAGYHAVIAASRFSSEGGCVDLPEVMIYSKSQALPQYLIWYQHMEDCRCQWCG